jgi:CBS domain-containing protein
MTTVKNLLEGKGSDIWSVSPDVSVYTALMLMAEKRIGALVVIENEQLVGILSERDYARKVILKGKSSRETTVKDIMTAKVYVVGPEYGIDECMALMTEHSIRHLPVMEGTELAGVISIGDVVKAVISDQEFIIGQLEQFITGTGR